MPSEQTTSATRSFFCSAQHNTSSKLCVRHKKTRIHRKDTDIAICLQRFLSQPNKSQNLSPPPSSPFPFSPDVPKPSRQLQRHRPSTCANHPRARSVEKNKSWLSPLLHVSRGHLWGQTDISTRDRSSVQPSFIICLAWPILALGKASVKAKIFSATPFLPSRA